MNFLIVDFEVRTADEEFSPYLRIAIDVAKNMLETPGDDAWVVWLTKHSVRLSATCLTVRKDCTVIALNNRFNQWERTLIVHYLL